MAAEREGAVEMNQPKPEGTRARAWTIVDGRLKPVRVVRGIQTTRYAEVLWTDLKEGDSLIVGSNGNSSSQSQVTGSNPFMPRFGPGGGGGRR